MKKQQLIAVLLTTAMLGACGGGSSSGSDSSQPTATPASATPTPVATPATTSPPTVISTTTCPAITLNGTDAQTLTGAGTPLQTAQYGIRNYSVPALVNGLHNPSNYKVAPVIPTWQFASLDPTSGGLSNLECDVAPDTGWHSYKRSSGTAATITHSKVVVTGGRNAAKENIYTQ